MSDSNLPPPNVSEEPASGHDPPVDLGTANVSESQNKTVHRGHWTENRWLGAVAAARPLGLVLVVTAGLLLTAFTFRLLNSLFDATVFSHLKTFVPLSTEDQKELLHAALGVSRDEERSLTEMFSQLTVRAFAGEYDTKLGPDEQLDIVDGVDAPVALEESNEDVFTIVWWNASTTEATMPPDDETESEAPTDEVPAVPGPSAKPSVEFPLAYVLEIRRERDGHSLRIVARYRAFVNGEDYESPRKSDFLVLDRPAYAVGLRPCAVLRGAEALAARFPEQMKRDLSGLTKKEVTGAILKDRREKERVIRFIREALIRQLGRETESSVTRQGIIPDREFDTLEDLTFLPRIVNGSDALGFVQFFTMFGFWMLAVQAISRLLVASGMQRFFRDPDLFPQFGGTVDPRLASDKVKLIEEHRRAFRVATHSSGPCPPLDVAHAGYSALVSTGGRYDAVPSFVESGVNLLNDRMATGQWLLRYLIWLIPSIGFIGTVIGIGAALLGTGDVLADNPIEQQAAIQAIARKLGTAFDTTFIALILSIVGMLLLNVVQRAEEELVQRSADLTLDSLIDPHQVTPDSDNELLTAIRELQQSIASGGGAGAAPTPRSVPPKRPDRRKPAVPSRVLESQTPRNRLGTDLFVGLILAGCAVVVIAVVMGSDGESAAASIRNWLSSLFASGAE